MVSVRRLVKDGPSISPSDSAEDALEDREQLCKPGRMDPRVYQITALTGLLVYGMAWLDFDISTGQAAVTLGMVIAAQWACTQLWKLPHFEIKSALISGLSLCLLLRTNHLAWVALGAAVTIASKFLLRWNHKHLFNPTNFGLVAMMLATRGEVWVSPGQWGNVAFFGFLMVCLGGLVIHRAARSDVTLAFLGCWVVALVGRSLYLGEPMAIPLHRLQSGALLLFAFFMISDPKTTPDSRAGRFLFAAFVALGAWFVQFRLFETNGLLWSLACWSLAVPLIDRLLPGKRYDWAAYAKRPLTGGSKSGHFERSEAPPISAVLFGAPHTEPSLTSERRQRKVEEAASISERPPPPAQPVALGSFHSR